MEPLTLGSQTPEEQEERQAALDRGDAVPRCSATATAASGSSISEAVGLGHGRPSLRGGHLPAVGPRGLAAARRARRYRAGEWTICDDGWSQNGTWVNGLRLAGRRRLADGDLVKIGRTIIGFHQPGVERARADDGGGRAVSATPRFSEQQQRILRALCRPLFADGDGFNPSSDLEVADATGIDVDVVTQELDLLARLFGLEDMPRPERRAEVALLAVRSGLVGADEGGGTQG